MTEPMPAESGDDIRVTSYAWPDQSDESEGLPGRALMIVVALAVVVLAAAVVAAVMLFVAA